MAIASHEGQRRNTIAYAKDLERAADRIAALEADNARLREELTAYTDALRVAIREANCARPAPPQTLQKF